jgi:hypothetical protein|tara:strand:+ start:4321 stop:4500 length:180 start_codon:yes stop_codon:yes gene_type:complete
VTTSEYFRLRDDDTESDSDTETDSESDSGIDSINVGMLKGYMKPKCYKKILIEEELLPD